MEHLDRIIRNAELRRRLSVSRSTLHRMVKRGELPPPLRLSVGVVGWRASTISALLEQREHEASIDGAA